MSHESERRLRQLRRTLLIIELLAPLRYGATVPEIAADVRDLMGVGYCDRTIRRDLESLEHIGLVERLPAGRNWSAPPRWQWSDRSLRSVIYRHTAERQAGGIEDGPAVMPAVA